VSDEGKHAPQRGAAPTVSVQASFRHDAGAHPLSGYTQAPPPEPDDAEAHYRRGMEYRGLGHLTDALASLDKAIALKPDYAEAYNGRGIVLSGMQRLVDAATAFDRAIAIKPDYAEAYNNRGIVLQDMQRHGEALASFQHAIALQPGNARIHNNRADVLRALGRVEESLASYDAAIALKPDYAEAYYSRAIVLQEFKRFDEALANYDRAIALRPDYAAAYNNRGVLLQALQRCEDAAAAFARAIAIDPGFAEACSNQAYCLLQMGRFEEGWRLHEWRKRTAKPVGHRAFPQPLWLGGAALAGKTVFVHWEQGFGDTIQFCRYGKLLRARGALVVMAVQTPLRRLLQSLGHGIAIVGQDEVPRAFDCHCPMMSLPLALHTTLESIPSEPRYLFADGRQSRAWAARLPPRSKPRIGLVWSGSAHHKNDRNRSIALTKLTPLLTARTHWISLQKDLRNGDAALIRQLRHVLHLGDALADFSDTAAVIEHLDLVVAVDTAVAHLAGAMGKPVWILLPYNADWRWLLDRADSPWYPTARLFRQRDIHSWEGVIGQLAAALNDLPTSAS